MQHSFDLGRIDPSRGNFDRHAARPEGLDLETVLGKLIGYLREHRQLGRRKFEDQRHEQALAFHSLGGALFHDLFEEYALVGHVLVDDPESFVVDREDEGLADLAKRLE